MYEYRVLKCHILQTNDVKVFLSIGIDIINSIKFKVIFHLKFEGVAQFVSALKGVALG